MKTYLINAFKKVSATNQFLNFASIIKAQEWIVFDEDSPYVKKFLFIDNENLLVSVNGKSSYSRWEYIKINSSLVIDDVKSKYLFKIIVCNKDIIVLNVDGTSNYSFLINSKSSTWDNITYADIQWYLMKKCGIDILNEKQREQFIKEQKNKADKKNKEVKERKRKQQKNIKRCFVVVGIILLAYALINKYLDYKRRHPTIYITEIQNQVAVDLGLSLKWATCNIGANSPEESGNYYGWGEPTRSDVFDYDCESVGKLQERFPIREYDTPPPHSIINTPYDIVKQNWGGKWRMPTKAEVQELLIRCNIVVYESDGKKMVKVIGPNGNFIIFPCAGFSDGAGEKHDEHSVCLYIGELYSTKSTYECAENKAAYLFIGKTYGENYESELTIKINPIERYKMLPVRAVLDE